MSSLECARAAVMRPIVDVAADAGILPDELELYGRYKAKVDLSILELRLSIMEWMERLGMDPSFGDRYLNEGFSGGEKKRNEVLQMAILEPEMAILDETDSGLDINALRTVSRGVPEVRARRPGPVPPRGPRPRPSPANPSPSL